MNTMPDCITALGTLFYSDEAKGLVARKRIFNPYLVVKNLKRDEHAPENEIVAVEWTIRPGHLLVIGLGFPQRSNRPKEPNLYVISGLALPIALVMVGREFEKFRQNYQRLQAGDESVVIIKCTPANPSSTLPAPQSV